MIDLTDPPVPAGDVAYTNPPPGGMTSVPADPTGDVAYAVPSLGGEFQPGSGKAAPTASPITKGADADGGAQDIKDAPRTGAPTPPAPVTPPALAATVALPNIIFSGKAAAAKTCTVTYAVDGGSNKTAVQAIANGTTAGTAAALVAAKLM